MFILSSANAFNLEQSKILSFGKDLLKGLFHFYLADDGPTFLSFLMFIWKKQKVDVLQSILFHNLVFMAHLPHNEVVTFFIPTTL